MKTLSGLVILRVKILENRCYYEKKISSQFWIGKINSVDRFNRFIGENEEFWSEENEINETIPLSDFIASQGENWYDHDFMEAGYSDKNLSVVEKFKAHSWVNQWANQIEDKIKEFGLLEVNAFIMMVIDQPPTGPRYLQVDKPISVKQEGIDLIYIGEIRF